jgi:hypothetical protein
VRTVSKTDISAVQCLVICASTSGCLSNLPAMRNRATPANGQPVPEESHVMARSEKGRCFSHVLLGFPRYHDDRDSRVHYPAKEQAAELSIDESGAAFIVLSVRWSRWPMGEWCFVPDP